MITVYLPVAGCHWTLKHQEENFYCCKIETWVWITVTNSKEPVFSPFVATFLKALHSFPGFYEHVVYKVKAAD